MYFPYLQFASWDNFLHYFSKSTCSRGDPLGEVSVPPRYFSQESVSQHGDDLLPEHGGQLGKTFSLFRKKTFTFQFSNNSVNSRHLRQTLLWQWTAATMARAVARPARTQTPASRVCSPLARDPHLFVFMLACELLEL